VDGQFEEWARARIPQLLRAAFLLTGDRQSAEDLTQAGLEKVALSWSRIDNPDAYVRRVMYRLEIRRWRNRRRELSTSAVADAGHDPIPGADVRIVMAGALRRLTRGQRAVLVLRFWEDLTEAQTAEALGCSIGTVKSQTFKALRALKDNAPELADLVERTTADVRS
jgi:RNA polymerase sigma-70 factor (sigma-E family)